jgi:hypothetical protein
MQKAMTGAPNVGYLSEQHCENDLVKLGWTVLENEPSAYYIVFRSPDQRNLRLDFINSKPKKAVKHLVSVIRPATLKTLIESKLEMDKSELKKDFLEFVKYLEEMAIVMRC